MTETRRKNLPVRIRHFQIFIGVVASLMILRIFYISVIQHKFYVAQAQNQHDYFQTLVPNRGDIFISDKATEKEYTVATDLKKDLVYAVPSSIKDPKAVAAELSKIVGISAEEIEGKISDPSKHYVVIQKQISDDVSAQIKKSKIQGIAIDQETTRYYPEGEYLAQVLGFIGYTNKGDDKVGLYGLEKYFNKDLAGQAGSVSGEADLHGNWISGSDRNLVQQKDGASLVLTIDRSIQFKAETVLKDTVEKHGADSGSIIVADPKTGAILAMANYPEFNPNEYGKASTPADYLNSATMKSYEPGSTMKAVTMATALDLGLVSPQTTYEDTGVVEIGGYKIKNSDGKANGNQRMIDVLDKSLNTGAIFVEEKIGNDRFKKSLDNFGFGKPTEIELQEGVGDLSNLKSNSDINYYTASFGQGITVTPIQMLQAYMVMANGGKLMQPYIVDREIESDGTVIKTQPKMVRQVISAQAASAISGMLVDVVENGHGKKAAVKGYWIAGKTGTAQVAESGKYVANDNIGSFIGYGPVEDPKFVMLIKVDHPRDVSFAESTAGPAFGNIAQFILNYYQIPPTRK